MGINRALKFVRNVLRASKGWLAFAFVCFAGETILIQAVHAQSGNVPPVAAVYHGEKQYNGFRVNAMYDAWTYGDIVFYAPPGNVTQEMANQWLAWYAHVDDLYRAVVPRTDTDFDLGFRDNDPHFGRKKVLAMVTESCGAGCGSKTRAEAVGILEPAVADPYDFTHHWILFYEMGRGGVDETFDLKANWPVQQYFLPHLMASLAFHSIGGMEGLLRDVPGEIYTALDRWEQSGNQYVDFFVDQNQTWFDPAGFFPLSLNILLRIAVETDYQTVREILDNISDYLSSPRIETSVEAMCLFQEAVNDATNSEYADRLVDNWGMPACDILVEPSSLSEFSSDLQNEGSGKCISNNIFNAPRLAQDSCNGSDEQQFFEVAGSNGFRLQLSNTDECLEDGYGGGLVNLWRCSDVPHMTFNWDEGRLRSNFSDLCVTVNEGKSSRGARMHMEPCTDSAFQRFNSIPPAPAASGYAIQNIGSNRCLDQPGDQDGNGGNVHQWDCASGSDNQYFKVLPGNGGFSLELQHSGKCLDATGENISQGDCNGGDNQVFNWDGAQLRLKNSDQCVSLASDFSENGTNVIVDSCKNSSSQRFRAIDQDDSPELVSRLSIGNASVHEADGYASVELSLDRPLNRNQSVFVYTQPKTAVNGTDFYGIAQTLEFAAGTTTLNVQVPIIDDSEPESYEYFSIHVKVPILDDLAIARRNGQINIFNDDF